jgi:hypothetical protein
MTVCASKTLSHGSYKHWPEKILGGIQLRGICRQVYEETHNFFWRNSFKIRDFSKELKPLTPILSENLQNVTWAWWSFKIKDRKFLSMLKDCVNLKVFHITLTKYTISPHYNPGRPWLHRDEPAVAKFKHANGFDELFRLRGLQTVTVVNETGDLGIGSVSDAEIKAFEAFLIQQITQPRSPPKVCAKRAF